MSQICHQITKIISSLECHARKKGKCFKSTRYYLSSCSNAHRVTHCKEVPLHPQIRATGIPQVAKLGNPGKIWLKAT